MCDDKFDPEYIRFALIMAGSDAELEAVWCHVLAGFIVARSLSFLFYVGRWASQTSRTPGLQDWDVLRWRDIWTQCPLSNQPVSVTVGLDSIINA